MNDYIPLLTLGTHFVSFIFGACSLIYYRLRKQHKKDRASKWKEIIETNMVEIGIIVMFIAFVVPDWASLILLR